MDLQHWVDPDPWGPTADNSRKAVTKAAVERKMKFATVLDQGDESEFTTATEEQKQLWLQSVVNQTGSAAEETGEGAGPYADFSAFLPHGGKAHRSQKYRTYIHTAFRDPSSSGRRVAGCIALPS